ncbi:MAG: Uma2 family endonuclease [Gemmataceae bacterium]|nr:Uma2 family endonuclease [Gemmataceae bacterium]
MTAAKRLPFITEEEYLAGEALSPVKHEYVDGTVYAMAGSVNVHSRIGYRMGFRFGARLEGGRCIPFVFEVKVRVRVRKHRRYYYPDGGVTCDPNPPGDTWEDNPVVLWEVISESTRRTDQGEKLDAYLTLPSLRVYLLVESSRHLIVAHRRVGAEFVREVYEGLDAVVPLPEIGTELTLREVYQGIEFVPEEAEQP